MKSKLILPVALIFFIFDFVSKTLVAKFIHFNTFVPVINKVFGLTYITNTGAAFSVLEKKTLYLVIFSFLILAWLVYYFNFKLKTVSKLEFWGWAMIAGGTLGNLYDRIVYKHVIDFIYLRFINFPIFNFADIFINIGAFFIILYIILDNKRSVTDEKM